MSRPNTAKTYRGRFADWDKNASVRVKPLVFLRSSEADAGLLFSPDLVPLLHHPLVARRGPRAAEIVLARHLMNYLDFTDQLENVVVTPVAYRLGRGIPGLQLDRRMMMDARKIAVDEMHHALCATQVMEEVGAIADIALPSTRTLPLLAGLDEIASGVEPGLRPLLLLLFAVVSETLITGPLLQIPNDSRVRSTVRRLVADHAEDELRHHAFFADLLECVWPQLEPKHRTLLGPLLPRMIHLFLSRDTEFETETLRYMGLNAREIEQIISQTSINMNNNVANFAASTLRYVRRCGALEEPKTREAFVAALLLQE